MRRMRFGRLGSLGAVLGALLWVAGYIVGLAQYPEGTEIPAWVDALLYGGLLLLVVSILVIVGTAASVLVRRPRS